jgi:hypothetical protein
MDMKVFCPAWALVLAQNPALKEKIEQGNATPREVTAAFKHSFQLDAVQAAAIEGVLAFVDLKDFVKNQVSLNSIMTRGAAIHVAIDFGIERTRSQLELAGAGEEEILRRTNARFDQVFAQFAVDGPRGEKLIPVSSRDLAAITRENVRQRLAENPGADDGVLRTDVVMAGELAAAASFLHPFIGRPDLADGRKTISYNELRDWFVQQKLPEREPNATAAPNPFTLTLETAARLAPGAVVQDLERSFSHVLKGAEIALGLATSDPPAINREAMAGAQTASRCPFAGRLFTPGVTEHAPVFTDGKADG